jgi:threonine/homoserine/homoserine lactone efflux protein
MPDSATILLFVGAALILLIIPGPATIYIMTRSIHQGRGAGIISALGISLGTLIHVSAAALGLSAILVSSATAFAIVKYMGALYLIYLGIKELFSKKELKKQKEQDYVPAVNLKRIFYEGSLVNLLNPKLALFMLSFLPQFISVEKGPVATQILYLGFILISLGFFTDSMYALLASKVGEWLKKSSSFMEKQKYATGAVYIVLGMITASFNLPLFNQ